MEMRRSFTLIELLVIVSIMIILLSILMPGLNVARERSKSIACLSTLRQSGTALLSYTADNQEWIPAAKDTSSAIYWFQKLVVNNYLTDYAVTRCPITATGIDYSFAGYGLLGGAYDNSAFRLQQIQAPSLRLLIGDSADTLSQLNGGPSLATFYLTARFANLRHVKKMNAWFVDGHGQSLGWDKLAESGLKNSTKYILDGSLFVE